MNTTQKISVVMPFYNCERFLDDAIQSILNQTFTDFEFIIINDASTDASTGIAKKYTSDARIAYFSYNQKQGECKATNIGITKAKTPYIALMHGDDIACPERLAQQYEYMIHNLSVDILGTWAYLIDENNKRYRLVKKPQNHKEICSVIFKFAPIIHPTIMYKKDIFKKIGLYDETLTSAPDYEIFFRAIAKGAILHNLPSPLMNYRVHNRRLSAKHKEEAKVMLRITKEAIKKYDIKPTFKEIIFVYGRYLVAVLLPRHFTNIFEKIYKKLAYHE